MHTTCNRSVNGRRALRAQETNRHAELVQTFYLQKAIYEGRGPCRLDLWLVPHILGLAVGGQSDREPRLSHSEELIISANFEIKNGFCSTGLSLNKTGLPLGP
jgi:hypothetical protein